MAKFSNIIKENNEKLLIDKFVEKFRKKTNKTLKNCDIDKPRNLAKSVTVE